MQDAALPAFLHLQLALTHSNTQIEAYIMPAFKKCLMTVAMCYQESSRGLISGHLDKIV